MGVGIEQMGRSYRQPLGVNVAFVKKRRMFKNIDRLEPTRTIVIIRLIGVLTERMLLKSMAATENLAGGASI